MIENIKNLLNIDENEVLRYLQYKNQDLSEEIKNQIQESIQLTKETINPRCIYKICSVEKCKTEEDEKVVYLKEGNIKFESNDTYNLLSECDECILMSATLGLEIEKEIRKLTYTDLTKGIIVDACATTAIEEVCDTLQYNIEKNLLKEEKYITMRYSPGYGDLPIGKNKDIIDILNSQKEIGLTVTESGIMIPRKSVVALIGISKKRIKKLRRSCEDCGNKDNCKFKKEAKSCGD